MWQLITILVLLAAMISLEQFNLVPIEQYLGEAPPFTPKSLAATGFIILAAFTTGALFQRFKIPALLGYIAAGIIFGPELIQIAYETGVAYAPETTASIFGDDAPRALFGNKVIKDLGLINILTVGVIGTMGGGELKISDIKDSWKLILGAISLIIVTAIPLTIAIVMGLTYVPLGLAPFLQGIPQTSQFAAALLFGILTVAMSPAATLAIIQETKARGRFTSLTLGIVVVADLALVALFLVGFNISKLLVAPEGFSFAKLMQALPGIGLEFAWALVIGTVTGIIFILYMRYVRQEMMLFTVGIIFATSYVASVLHAETLLAFLTAGFIVQNFSRHGHDLIHELEKISTPVFIIYFMTQAAQLDLKGVIAYLPLTLILAVARGASFYGSVRFAARRAQEDDMTQRWLWASFFSRGGVDLVLAAMVATAMADGGPLFSWGTDFQTVVMATVVVHIIVGPPLLKIALGKAEETAETRNKASQAGEDAGGDDMIGPNLEEVEFPVPDFSDRYLNERLHEMRDGLISLHAELIAEPLDERRRRLEESVSNLRDDVGESLTKLSSILKSERYDSQEALSRSVRSLYTQSRRKLQPYVQLWERLDPLAFEVRSAEQLIGRIQQFERFENQFSVELEDELYDAQAASRPTIRLLRRLRSLQKLVTSRRGRRTIPLGRLWRYYIELSIPRYLSRAATATAEPHELFWYELGCYLRRFDTIFEETLRQLDTPAIEPVSPEPEASEEGDAPADTSSSMEIAASDASGELKDEEEAHNSPTQEESEDPHSLEATLRQIDPKEDPRTRAVALVEATREVHEDNARKVIACLNDWLIASTQGYSWSLQQAYATFLGAVARAGTLELPSIKYRPSSQFDEARRAEAQLGQQLEREAHIVSAYVGWIVLDHQLALFEHWFGQYQQRITDTLDSLFKEQSLRQLKRMEDRVSEGILMLEGEVPVPDGASPDEQEVPDEVEASGDSEDGQAVTPAIDWEAWLEEKILPVARATRRSLDRALISFGQGVTTRRLIDALEYRVAGFSESLRLLMQDPHRTPPSQGNLETMRLKVRQWFSTHLVSEIALHYIEFNERTENIIRRNLVALDGLNQVLEYNLLTGQDVLKETPSTAEINGGGDDVVPEGTTLAALQRAKRQLRQQVDQLHADIDGLKQWILEETEELQKEATGPFLEHRIGELQRQLMRHSPDADPNLATRLEPIVGRVKRLWSNIAPLYDELVKDVRHILHDEPAAQQRMRVRKRLELEPPESMQQLDPLYRRLFNPVPLDLPEFHVDRPDLKEQCLDAISQWGRNRRISILLFGDRGIGKRTFIHNLIPIEVYDLAPVFQRTPIQTIRLGEEVRNEEQLCAQFDILFPNDTPRTLRHLTKLVQSQDQRQIVLVENASKCYQRTAEGMELCKRFLQMINDTSDDILWVLLMDAPAATLLDTMIDLFDYFSHVFEVESFDHEQVEEMILNRHRVSGFEVEYTSPDLRILYRTRHPLEASEAARNPRRDYFKRLGEASHGNPLLALLYWLRSVRPDPEDETTLLVEPIEAKEIELITSLSLTKRLILAMLLQHDSLTVEQLSAILNRPKLEVQTELDHLGRLGFLEATVGSTGNYHLRDLAAAEVTTELRQANLV